MCRQCLGRRGYFHHRRLDVAAVPRLQLEEHGRADRLPARDRHLLGARLRAGRARARAHRCAHQRPAAGPAAVLRRSRPAAARRSRRFSGLGVDHAGARVDRVSRHGSQPAVGAARHPAGHLGTRTVRFLPADGPDGGRSRADAAEERRRGRRPDARGEELRGRDRGSAGSRRRGEQSRSMIAIVFLAVLLVIALVFAAVGGPQLPVFAIVALCLLFALFFCAGIYIAAALGILGLIVGYTFSDRPFWLFLGGAIWGPSSNFVFVAVPLFLLMGEILLRAGLSERLYCALNVWLAPLPGGLLHTNIISCGVFSAISGSSGATAATMGAVALPYFANTHYNPRVVLGSLAAGGAPGNLIPPGITFIGYGLLTETAVRKPDIAAAGPSRPGG